MFPGLGLGTKAKENKGTTSGKTLADGHLFHNSDSD